jgi:hypothetical protein
MTAVTDTLQPFILLVGQDPALAYLLERYGQHSGHGLRSVQSVPTFVDVCAMAPAAVWFTSLETLEASIRVEPLSASLANSDIPLVVCSSVADETRARELGADYCVLHPLTYPDFVTILSAIGVAGAEKRP